MPKILFVCHGNICRSPMAEFVFKDLVRQAGRESEFEIASCAVSSEEIGCDMYPPAKRKLSEKGIPFSSRRARKITKADASHYDRILCMDRSNMRLLSRIIPMDKAEMLLERDVADPWYTGNFELTYQDILTGCQRLLAQY